MEGCRADFDFTQVFERTMLWSVPSTIFILAATLRFLHITSKPRIVSAFHLQVAKSVSLSTSFGAHDPGLYAYARTCQN